jgi:DNA (cytosine-5)-methyltransferase 1
VHSARVRAARWHVRGPASARAGCAWQRQTRACVHFVRAMRGRRACAGTCRRGHRDATDARGRVAGSARCSVKAIDLFCGAGGASTGFARAGIKVVAAVNHWRTAVDTHSANHPGAVHVCQDAGLVDPRDMPAHDILVAAPACQGHSRARGVDRPHHDASRATAWCVVNFAEVCQPKWIVVENVPEFLRWKLFPVWHEALTRLGYWLTTNVLDAASFRVPQNRRRVFIVGRLKKMAPSIEEPRRKPVASRGILDLDAGEWTPVETLCQNTRERVRAVRERSQANEFLVSYYSGKWKSGERKHFGRTLDEPTPTITTKDRHAIVRGDHLRMLSVPEIRRAMGFPDSYVLHGSRTEQVKQLGNAWCPPVARAIAERIMEVA